VVGGFLGKGRGIIKCEGDVHLGFVHNQRVIADGNVTIDKSAIQAEIVTGGSLMMRRGRGKLIGGITKVTKHADIDEIGNDQHVNTTLIAGYDENLVEKVRWIKEDIEQCNKTLKYVKRKIGVLAVLQQRNHLNKETETLYRKLVKLLLLLSGREKDLTEEKNSLFKEIERNQRHSYIKINKRVYPGVRLKIAGFSRKFEKEWTSSTFRVVDGELVGAYH
jgi:uncharacterized protein (DUF342 family)